MWSMRAFEKMPATYDDIRRLPEGMNGEIVDGELVASPRPKTDHANVASSLNYELTGPFGRGKGGPGGWWILGEPELHLGANVLIPDLAGWRRERLPKLPNVPFMELAPDWICEITSRSTASFDRVKKLPVYLQAGVAHAWLVDPAGRTIEALRREHDRWVVVGNFPGDTSARIEPFEAHELDLRTLWLDSDEPENS
jgi:Uma2 family endonuclease